MTWFRVDDSFPQHPKVLAIPRRDRVAAIGLWTLAGTWCAAQLTDGHLGGHMVAELAASQKHADLLVRVGLWETVEGGYQVHDYLDYNPSAEEVRADQARKHEAKARAGRAGGIASGVARRKHSRSSDEAETKQTGSETKPRPDPSPTASSEAVPRKRGHRIPDDFRPSDDLCAWARDRGFNDAQITEITETFTRHWQAASGASASKLDWPKAWQNWVAKEDPRRVRGVSLAAVPSDRPLTGDQLLSILGPDRWSCPRPPAGLSPDEEWEWRRQQQVAHIEERQAQARARTGASA